MTVLEFVSARNRASGSCVSWIGGAGVDCEEGLIQKTYFSVYILHLLTSLLAAPSPVLHQKENDLAKALFVSEALCS